MKTGRASQGFINRWVNNLKLSGRTRRSTRGWGVRRCGAEGASRPLATFVTPRNGQSEVAKLNGAAIRVAELRKPIGVTRWCGMARLDHFRARTNDGSVCFAPPSQTYSITKSILNGVQIYSNLFARAISWIGSF